ncbi:hypothetical protein OG244_10730 [Streptomyces brevispora]|uniref:hypothetical protein n=1 Tax=Streptomyces brevispora TaxID=887462 RepID=UPI002E2EA7EE|nr:hypothetical protein [Streptomyces brevispora]
MTLVRVVKTCAGCPVQWDAWTPDGQYLYLRYRHGVGSVERQPCEDPGTWHDDPSETVAEWDDGAGSGQIELLDFLDRAGLSLVPGAEVSERLSMR